MNRISKKRIGKAGEVTKHLGKGIGSSRNRNMKRVNSELPSTKVEGF